MTQQLTKQGSRPKEATPAVDAFAQLMTAHRSLTRALNAALVAQHGLALNDYGCLLLLHRAGEEGIRRIDLANELQLSPSGITRLLDRLTDQGFVGRGACREDARESYAVITDDGAAKLREAATDHMDDIEQRLTAVLDDDEISTISELLAKFGEPEGACSPE
jgi:DNA-binding MarR family transcriptional regulator